MTKYQGRSGHSPDRETERTRRALADLQGLITKFNQDLLQGKFTETVVIDAGSTHVFTHKLGRKPKGFIQVDFFGQDNNLTRTAWDSKTISIYNLAASGVQVRYYVF